MAKEPKIALVHDYLREYGGAERVLEALHELYPKAPVYTAFVDSQALGIHWPRFQDWDIRESWMTRIPGYKKLFSPLRLLAPQFFQALDLRGYDVIISSTNAYFAKAVKVPPKATHLCYCHTPARSLYGYTTMSDWKQKWWTRWAGTLINHYLRVVDVQIARENVTVFIANSAETARRIKKFYKLNSHIIYPPVNIPSAVPARPRQLAEAYYLYVGRIAQSKHVDLVIQACTELKLALKVVGEGKGVAYLKTLAGPTVEFVGGVSDEVLAGYYAGARAVVFPAEDEDFGIVPIEAMGYGVPVIAHFSGGPKETIIEEKTGLFFHELTVPAVKEALLLSQRYDFNAKEIYRHAQQFSRERFQQAIATLVKNSL